MRDVVKHKLEIWGPRIALPITYVVLVAIFFVWTFPFDG